MTDNKAKHDPEHCISGSGCYGHKPIGEEMMKSEVWNKSQPKPKHRQIKVPGIKGERHIEYDEKAVTDAKMKRKNE